MRGSAVSSRAPAWPWRWRSRALGHHDHRHFPCQQPGHPLGNPHRPLRPRGRGQIRQPLAGRGWFVVDNVEHAGRLLLQGQDGSARRVVEMHPRYVAGAAPDQRELPLAHELDPVVDGARPVQAAVAQDRATSLDDHVLEVAERLRPLARARRARVRRVLLGLHPSTLADAVKGAKALRDDMGYAGRLGGGQQVIRPLGAQPDGGGEDGVLQIGLSGVRRGKCGHLVHDRVRPGRSHRLTDRHRIQPVHHDGVCAQARQQAQLGRARRRSRHLVAPGHELRHQPPPQGPAPACHEHPHNHHPLDSRIDSQPRDEATPAVCDIRSEDSWEKIVGGLLHDWAPATAQLANPSAVGDRRRLRSVCGATHW
jgi:hypothetical protein